MYASEVLAERYARGEIDDDEYARRLSILTYGPLLALPTFTVPSPESRDERLPTRHVGPVSHR